MCLLLFYANCMCRDVLHQRDVPVTSGPSAFTLHAAPRSMPCVRRNGINGVQRRSPHKPCANTRARQREMPFFPDFHPYFSTLSDIVPYNQIRFINTFQLVLMQRLATNEISESGPRSASNAHSTHTHNHMQWIAAKDITQKDV